MTEFILDDGSSVGINGLVKVTFIDGVVYRKNPTGTYALYLHTKTGSWRESALVTNKELENDATN